MQLSGPKLRGNIVLLIPKMTFTQCYGLADDRCHSRLRRSECDLNRTASEARSCNSLIWSGIRSNRVDTTHTLWRIDDTLAIAVKHEVKTVVIQHHGLSEAIGSLRMYVSRGEQKA